MSANTSHTKWMKLAIEEARKSSPEDSVRPHPFVGAVVVKDGKHLTSAHRGKSGPGNHAEYCALEKDLLQEEVSGSTVYTTLEPCTSRNHPKLPCAERLAERKVARVVIGMLDPNPEISGRGVTALRKANIEVELFPGDLMAEIEDLNREFIRFHRQQTAQRAADSGFLVANRNRTLDEWYLSVNAIYWNRNFYQDAKSIFTHLVEVIGGLSQLASHKEKNQNKPELFVPKALAWWMALCGKLGIRSVSDMLWAKFPDVCSYCLNSPHDPDICSEMKAKSEGPDWKQLAQLGLKNKQHKPATIREWQRMFSRIYPAQQTEDFGPVFARLTEELGELAEALRIFPASPGYSLAEAADVLAWLMHVQNVIEHRAKTPKAERGEQLQDTFCLTYPDRCLDCGAAACKCPPILPTTIGRIAHEGPEDVYGERFMTPEETRAKFQAALN
jgi:pyrimidine deaminase RibD-like protein/NTP pyrophosphatase (non-canonical NTP hydrolase)